MRNALDRSERGKEPLFRNQESAAAANGSERRCLLLICRLPGQVGTRAAKVRGVARFVP